MGKHAATHPNTTWIRPNYVNSVGFCGRCRLLRTWSWLTCCTTAEKCGHEYQTRDHLFKWCKRWKREQKELWKGVEKELKRKKVQVLMSLAFANKKCTDTVGFSFLQMSAELAEWWRGRTQITRSWWWGCKSWCFLADFVCFGEEGSQLCFCFLVLQEKRGENMLCIRHGRKRRNAIWLQTNKLRKNAHTWMPTGEAYGVNSERSEVTATRSWMRVKPQHQIQMRISIC